MNNNKIRVILQFRKSFFILKKIGHLVYFRHLKEISFTATVFRNHFRVVYAEFAFSNQKMFYGCLIFTINDLHAKQEYFTDKHDT